MSRINITKQDFEAYEKVRISGKTNMLDVRMVGALSDLSREQVLEIICNYGTFQDKYEEDKWKQNRGEGNGTQRKNSGFCM